MSLSKAARKGDRKGVETLLSEGANVNEKEFSYTPLHCSAQEGHADISTCPFRAL